LREPERWKKRGKISRPGPVSTTFISFPYTTYKYGMTGCAELPSSADEVGCTWEMKVTNYNEKENVYRWVLSIVDVTIVHP